MSKKSPAIPETREDRSLETDPEGVMLRDESDAIIDNLKNELQNLQNQLLGYRQGGEPPLAGAAERASGPEAFDAGLTPLIASRMQIPAEDLTLRLQRLIEQIDDPDLKAELENCRETATFLFDTFRRIGEKHHDLTDSLTADTLVLDVEEFRQRLEASLHERNLMVPLETRPGLPRRLAISPQSVITMLATLTDLAGHLFGAPIRVVLACPDASQGEGNDGRLLLQIECEESWMEESAGEPVSAAIIRSGMRSHAVVDLLYVEKIIEMRGGTLQFMARDGKSHGFEVHLPITIME